LSTHSIFMGRYRYVVCSEKLSSDVVCGKEMHIKNLKKVDVEYK
jgi:hypothetical protein